MRIFRLVAILIGLACLAPASYRFRHFGPDDGINTISGILQDRTGFLWVGTAAGLFRYDGPRFQHFGVEEGLPSASVRNLVEDAHGTLWVVTGRGLARRHKTVFETIPTGAEARVGDWHSLDAAGAACTSEPIRVCWEATFPPMGA